MATLVIAAVVAVFLFIYVIPLVLGLLAVRYAPATKVPTVAAVDAAWLDKRWVDGARPIVERLQSLGFTLRTYLDGMSPRTAPTGLRCAAMLVNDATGDIAQVAVMERLDDYGEVELVFLPIFTRSVASKRVATSNSDTPGVFLRPHEHAVQAFSMLHNVETLYAAHRGMCLRHFGAEKRGVAPAPGSEIKHVNRETAEEFAYQAKRGMCRTTREGGYERTWRGAFLGVWRLHPRFIRGHRRRNHDRALRLLNELGITPDPELPPKLSPAERAAELSPEMDAFISAACDEFNSSNNRLREEWDLDQATRFDADLGSGMMNFHFADGRTVIADLQVLGTWSRKAKSWEWAWNNPNIQDSAKVDGAKVRDFGEKSGIDYFASGFVPAPTMDMAAYLAALAAKVVGATGVLPLPPDAEADVIAFVALSNLRTVRTSAA
jgi:hypothetical protein